jgi:hypothetical protein
MPESSTLMSDLEPPPSREYAAALAGEELAAYAFIRAWMADEVDKGMLLIEQHHVPQEAAFVRAEPGQGGPPGAAVGRGLPG